MVTTFGTVSAAFTLDMFNSRTVKMVDSLSNISESMNSVLSEMPSNKQQLTGARIPAPNVGATTAISAMREPQIDQVQLSDAVNRTIESAKFDAAKVEAMRLAIMEGHYPLDAKRISENMISLERMIS